jgi:hypothetical protein
MSKAAIEALKVTELLDKNGKAVPLEGIEPIELQKRIDYYRDTRTRFAEADATKSIPEKRDLSALVSSVSASNAVVPLLPSCFVYNRLYTNDPLIRFARNPNQIAEAYSESLGFASEGIVDTKRIANKLQYFERLAPLIDLGFITVLPLDELHAPPVDGIPMFYSEDWFRSDVPSHIHDYIHKNAIVREVMPGPDGKGLVVLNDAPKTPTRGVCIEFQNDYTVNGSAFYLLHKMEVIERLNDGHYRFAQHLDWNDPPDKPHYDAWVYQSINKTVIARIESIARELGVSQQLQSSYLTESGFEAAICSMSSESKPRNDQSTNAVNFLNANAEFLKLDDPLILARLRTDHAKIFERWQLSLLYICDELSGVGDSFETQAKQLFEKEVQPQLDELKAALIKLGGEIGGASLLTAGTIGMALLSNTALPFAAVLGLGATAAGGRAIPSVADYASKRRGPSFIWNKLSR